MKFFTSAIIMTLTASVLVIALHNSPKAEQDTSTAEVAFWNSVHNSQDPAELKAYLDAFPSGKFAPLANIRIKRLTESIGEASDTTINSDNAEDENDNSNVMSPEKLAEPQEITISVRLGTHPDDALRARLGVEMMDLETNNAKGIAITLPKAVFVLRVILPSAAMDAGLVPGDIILSVGRTPISTGQELIKVIGNHTSGDVIDVKILRLAASPTELEIFFRRNLKNINDGGVSAYLLAKILSAGGFGEERKKDAFDLLKVSSNHGIRDAMHTLASAYYNGSYGEKDIANAIEWYHKAADAGASGAMNFLGNMYDQGEIVEKNEFQAFNWYRKAADAGWASAFNQVGNRYYFGRGVAKDHSEAVEWFRKGISADDSEAMYSLGFMYAQGQGITQNYIQSAQLFQKAVEREHRWAMAELADQFYWGKGVAEDHKIAAKWYERAAKLAVPSSMGSLAYMFRFGQGVKKDYQKALNWYRKGAEAGNAYSMNGIGGMYHDGEGVEKDTRQALEWYLKAAEKSNANGAYNAAILLDSGDGTSTDPAAAAKHLITAFQLGNEELLKGFLEEASRFSRNTRREIQHRLKELAVYTGKIDGKIGPASKRALKTLLVQSENMEAETTSSTTESFNAKSDDTPSLAKEFGDLKDLETLD